MACKSKTKLDSHEKPLVITTGLQKSIKEFLSNWNTQQKLKPFHFQFCVLLLFNKIISGYHFRHSANLLLLKFAQENTREYCSTVFYVQTSLRSSNTYFKTTESCLKDYFWNFEMLLTDSRRLISCINGWSILFIP